MKYLPVITYLVFRLEGHLDELIENIRVWADVVISHTIFCKAKLATTPALPGDSLLFHIGVSVATHLQFDPFPNFEMVAVDVFPCRRHRRYGDSAIKSVNDKRMNNYRFP
jgi:hypothetical protein